MFYLVKYKELSSEVEMTIKVEADGYSKDKIKKILEEVKPIKIIDIKKVS